MRLRLRPFVLKIAFFLFAAPIAIPIAFPGAIPRAIPNATAQTHSVVDVTYASGSTELAASLLIPEGKGPFPGVVLVHGSGSSDRSNPWTTAYASALVDRGIVVLHPDKRGSGESGGNWRTASFSQLAEDVVAGVGRLVSASVVDTSRIGLIGFSQGGHIVPLAASMSSDVDLVVNISGSVVPIMEQIGDELKLLAEREGLSEDQVRLVGDIHNRGVAFVTQGDSQWSAYEHALRSADSLGIARTDVVSGFPREQTSPAWDFLRTIGDFAPLPLWESLEVPTVFVYGGRDTNVDVFKSAAIIEKTLSRTALPYSLLLFRNNGHALYRDDVIEFLAEWLRDGGAG